MGERKAQLKDARFNMVMLPLERAMLAELAEHTGRSESDIVRQGIRRDYQETFGDRKPKIPKPKK